MVSSRGKTMQIKGSSPYFREKYGTANPEIVIEDTDKEVFGGDWFMQPGNPACLLYALRQRHEGLPGMGIGTVYYGKVCHRGELVHESELEKIKEEEANGKGQEG